MLTLVATEEAFNPAVNQCENADPIDFTANPLETQEAPKRRPRKGHTEGCSSSVAKKKNEVFESKWNEDERYEKLSITKKQIWVRKVTSQKDEEEEEEEEEKRASKQPRKAQANINVGIFLTTFRMIRAVTGEPRRKYLSATAIATATATATATVTVTVTATALSHTKTRSFLIEEGYIPENLDRIPHTVSSTDYLPQSLTDYPKTTPLGELCPR
uniref:Uncharacterized protein n=1 Tax=Vespula pensylvanica TaxID=30213 RepID=A0A834JVC9_VESPE|nr:hypothetical protein H0235_016896 [Vespula pensylvanica]